MDGVGIPASIAVVGWEGKVRGKGRDLGGEDEIWVGPVCRRSIVRLTTKHEHGGLFRVVVSFITPQFTQGFINFKGLEISTVFVRFSAKKHEIWAVFGDLDDSNLSQIQRLFYLKQPQVRMSDARRLLDVEESERSLRGGGRPNERGRKERGRKERGIGREGQSLSPNETRDGDQSFRSFRVSERRRQSSEEVWQSSALSPPPAN